MAHQVLAAPTPGAVPELGGPQPRLQVQSVPLLPRRFSQSPRAHQDTHRRGFPLTAIAGLQQPKARTYHKVLLSDTVHAMVEYRDVRNCHQKRHENKSKVGVTIFEDASRVWLGSKLFGARTLAWSQWAALVFVIRYLALSLTMSTEDVQLYSQRAVPRSCRSRLSESPASLTSRSQPHHRGYQPDLQLDHRISF